MPENSSLAVAISFWYIQLLEGALIIESQDGHGTTVAFDIPVDPIEPNREAARAGRRSRPVLALAQDQPHLILMVLGMLAMDGREAEQRIKTGSESRAPIIIDLAASSW